MTVINHNLVLIFLCLLTVSCTEKKNFALAEEMIPAKDKAAYQFIYLIGENSCNSCYGQIINADKDKSIVYVFSKTGDINEFKSFFENLKVQRDFTLLDFAAEYTKDFKGPYKIKIQDEEVSNITSYND